MKHIGEPGILKTVLSSEDPLGNKVISIIVQNCGLEMPKVLGFMDIKDEEKRKRASDQYFTHVLDTGKSLLKAIDCKNAYVREEESLVEKLRAREWKETGALEEELPSAMEKEVDGTFINVKASLDHLAQAFGALFQVSGVGRWDTRREKDGRVLYSGFKIRRKIENLPTQFKDKNDELLKLLDNFQAFLVPLVQMRDKPVHKSGLPLRGALINYVADDRGGRVEVARPAMIIDGVGYPVVDFLSGLLENAFNLTEMFLLRCLELKVGGPAADLAIVPMKDGAGVIQGYRWGIRKKG